MKGYAVTILVLLLILGFGGYILFSDRFFGGTSITSTSTATSTANSTTSPATTTSTSTTGSVSTSTSNVVQTVVYNGTSFSPSTVTIKLGQAVRFVNQSSGAMSVASDPHPTHVNYPEFDQFKSGERGQASYTFTFQKTGRWGFHNHQNPSVVGTVIVNP
jgi:plastocyanin